jgi:hypothetical protein
MSTGEVEEPLKAAESSMGEESSKAEGVSIREGSLKASKG